ncbi:hypothetical protein VNO78_24790 [Psophocarpus tetragonolobus]|uniref:C2H2-type domain-containing protein n=1 Tax=Psophocarpus tetragonolobus TaxID=3891 RepID=A0AAN9S5I4_PSOTE
MESKEGDAASPPMENKYCCKFCDMKFATYLALCGHQNEHNHKSEIEAEKEKKKNLSIASAGYSNSSVDGFCGHKTILWSPLSMTRNMSLYSWPPHMGPGHHILNPSNSNMHEPSSNSSSLPLSPHLSLCHKGNLGQATTSSTINHNEIIEDSDFNLKILSDDDNSDQENSSSSVNASGTE